MLSSFFNFSSTGCWIRERQRCQAPFQDPEHQCQHHPHSDGGPLPTSWQPGLAARLRGSVSGSKAERAAAAPPPASPLWPGYLWQWGRRRGGGARGEPEGSEVSGPSHKSHSSAHHPRPGACFTGELGEKQAFLSFKKKIVIFFILALFCAPSSLLES